MKFKSNIELQAGLEDNTASVGAENQILTSNGGTGAVQWNDVSAISAAVDGVESNITYYKVKNSSGATISAFKGVMAVGTDGNSGNILIDEMVADGSVDAKFFLGITRESVPNGGTSRVIAFGEISQVNTTAFANGTVLWCDPVTPGNFTITEPDGPNLKIPAAFVLNSATNGKIQVRVQGNEGIKDLYDTKIASQTDGDVLVWDNTTGVWFNDSTLNVDYTNNRVGIGTTSPTHNLQVVGNGAFNSTLDVQDPNVSDNGLLQLSHDSTGSSLYSNPGSSNGSTVVLRLGINYSEKMRIANNGNVGIGTTNPAEKLHVVGNGLFTGTLEVDTVNNGVGDFLTRTAGGVITRRTAAEVRSDIGAQPSGNYLTTTTSFGGDVSGAYNAIIVADNSHLHDNTTLDMHFGRETQNIDTYDPDSFWATSRATGGLGTYPGTYYNIYNFAGNGSSEGTQLATFYGPNNKTYIRSRSDNGNVWLSWEQVWTSGTDGVDSGLDADLLDGQHASAFAPVSHTHTWASIPNNSVNSWGGLRHQTNSGYIDFGPANSNHAHIYTDRPNFYYNKDILVNGVVVLKGAGTTNYLSKFTGSTTLGNSLVYDNGTNVGIGTTTPGVRFVNSGGPSASGPTLGSGTVGSQALLAANGLYGMYSGVSNSGDVWHQIQRNDGSTTVYNLLLQPNGGNVGIGTASPSERLNVSGNILATGTITGSNLSGTNTGDQQDIIGNANSATTLQTARTINGTSFNGSANITTANWGTARTINGTSINGSTNYTTANWGTARTITIGNTGKSVNGSANVSWTVGEIDDTIVRRTGTLTSQDWNTFIDGTEASWLAVSNASGSNRPTSAYNYGTVLNLSTVSEAKFQLYAPETASSGNGLWYRTGWNTIYRAWSRIWDDVNLVNPVTGTGTANYLPKFTGSTTLGNSLVFDNGTNVGIGTTAPAYTLDVNGSLHSTYLNIADAIYHENDSNTYIQFVSNDTIRWVTNGAERMRLNSSGSLGINTSSPGATFHVNGTGLFSDNTSINAEGKYFQTAGSFIWGGAQTIGVRMGTDNVAGLIDFRRWLGGGTSHQVAAVRQVLGGSSRYGLGFLANDISTNSLATTVRMYIDPNNGNVGIDTTSPSAKLHVKGNILSYTEATNTASLFIAANNTDNYQLGMNNGSQFVITRGGGLNGLGTEFMRINTGGNVSIGNTNNTYKLDVSGTIRATGDVIAFSDVRLKENINTIENALDKVIQLRGVEYNKIGEDEQSIGVIAQEVEKILPQVVKEDENGMKSVAYGNIVGVLIEAIKEQQKQIEELKMKIDGITN